MNENRPTVSAAEIAALNEARRVCKAIAGRALYVTDAKQEDGIVYAMANTAEGAIFNVLNYSDTYWNLGLDSEQLHGSRA